MKRWYLIDDDDPSYKVDVTDEVHNLARLMNSMDQRILSTMLMGAYAYQTWMTILSKTTVATKRG